MSRISPYALSLAAVLAVAAAGPIATAAEPVELVLRDLNQTKSVNVSKAAKSYPLLFEAYMKLPRPPMPIGPGFNMSTIHPGMADWQKIAGWSESNSALADAIMQCEKENRTIFGLPYGTADLESEFRESGLVAAVGVGGSLRDNQFRYLDAMDVIAAYMTAETYRRFEAGRQQDAIDLLMASCYVLRQVCDREFRVEVLKGVELLTGMLDNVRDMFYLYRENITAEQCRETAMFRLPYLRPDRQRLLMPEGDRRVSEALIKEVFGAGGQPDRDKFAGTFASIQASDMALTQFGAARRWRMIAEVHDSEDAALERLGLVYDDWWRRWRVEEYDPILDIPTQFDRTNPVRYAAVIYSMQDIEGLFNARNKLLTSVYGTSMAIGVLGYNKHFGVYPRSSDMTYAQFVRKRSDRDPFDTEFKPFKYRVLDSAFTIDTATTRLHLEAGQGILYSKGYDHEDNRGQNHTDSGTSGDLVLWPPVKALLREAGHLN